MNSEHPTLVVSRGDSLDSVRNILRLSSPPEALDESDGPGYFYHLPGLGFRVFFDGAKQVYSIRFDHPYPYAVEGVRIGDTEEDVINARGKPDRHFPVPDGQARWIYDRPRFLRVDFNPETNRVETIFR